MKHINVGKKNDLSVKAIEADGRYHPMTDEDARFEQPDVEIGYDSGVYPGITLEELPQYICDKAASTK